MCATFSPCAPQSWSGLLVTATINDIGSTILFFWPCRFGLTAVPLRSLGLDNECIPSGSSPETIAIQAVAYLVGWTSTVKSDLERTKTRPIASGVISVPAALLFLLVHCIAFFAILALAGFQAFVVGTIGFFTWEAIYPLSKRFTNWPQAFLGFDCAWGFPVVWISVNGVWDWKLVTAIVLGITAWTIHFDTIYALQDKEDDINAGVHSCALLFGDKVRPILSVFATFFVGTLAYAGYLNHQGAFYYVITVGGTGLHMLWQLLTPDLVANGGKIWKSNGQLGYLVEAGLLADYIHKVIM
ncbi:UbiA prenyltransferase family-domain-containing protein [Fomitopsis serialis]|uniref:UbiA prenyltransferase family-domain-containing protein n=1 Tax=Fomitopsis serialis TaxID=139415 RepID=UPI002008CB3E|nr:UbiA prenyltransferase family-domain-containing protein [Neoantrodia serialis]KAH9930223.1 UbiA prenyltransferase family-domain-containing protein [Neoantrodia serialis]